MYTHMYYTHTHTHTYRDFARPDMKDPGMPCSLAGPRGTDAGADTIVSVRVYHSEELAANSIVIKMLKSPLKINLAL